MRATPILRCECRPTLVLHHHDFLASIESDTLSGCDIEDGLIRKPLPQQRIEASARRVGGIRTDACNLLDRGLRTMIWFAKWRSAVHDPQRWTLTTNCLDRVHVPFEHTIDIGRATDVGAGKLEKRDVDRCGLI